MKRTQQNPFYHGEGDVYTHTQMVYRELIEMPDLISFRETVCALVRHHMLPIHLMVREDPERKIQEVAALGDLSGTGDSPLFHFLCDKPWGTSRACTKMYPIANGQSSRSILLDCDKPACVPIAPGDCRKQNSRYQILILYIDVRVKQNTVRSAGNKTAGVFHQKGEEHHEKGKSEKP